MEGLLYKDIREKCLETNILYEDPDFPANYRSLFRNGPMFGVRWMRPWEISKKPIYIKDGITYPDIHQGLVGDCWFIASVAALAASPQSVILNRVIPADQNFTKAAYCGAFRFYFWRYGKWVEVIIDDRLPTFNGKLIYASNTSDPDEYWCPLLEKAFAKFHGNYHEIDGGRLHASMVDLSGGLSELLELKGKITDEELKKIILNSQKMNSFMGGAIFNHQSSPVAREVERADGLFEGHAYSVINVKEVQNGSTSTTLLHLRNPWGKGEWKGAWSDGSSEWKTLSESDRQTTFKNRDDGEFWISLSDFRQNFDELELCHLTPDALSKEIADNLQRSQWIVTEHHGSWVRGLSAGGPPRTFTSESFWSNPQYRVKLAHATEPTTVVVSLFRVMNVPDYDNISIGFVIFKLKEGRKPSPSRITADNYYEYYPRLVATSGLFWPYRERTVRLEMEPAEHIIVPCTYNAGEEADFYMRVFAEGDVITENIEDDNEPLEPVSGDNTAPEKPKEPDALAVDTTFTEIAGNDGSVDAADLVQIFNAGLRAGDDKQHSGLNVETCRCLIALSELGSEKGTLDKPGVEKVWKDLAVWRRAFKLVDSDDNNTVDSSEFANLFDKVDLVVGQEAVDTIMKRYGGKAGKISEEDFLQAFCRSMLACRSYTHLKSKGMISMSLNEWLTTTLKI